MSADMPAQTLLIWDPMDILIHEVAEELRPEDHHSIFRSHTDALMPLFQISARMPNVKQAISTSLSGSALGNWVARYKLESIFARTYSKLNGDIKTHLELARLEFVNARFVYVTSAISNLKVLDPQRAKERQEGKSWQKGRYTCVAFCPRDCRMILRDQHALVKLQRYFSAGADLLAASTSEIYHLLKDGFNEYISE